MSDFICRTTDIGALEIPDDARGLLITRSYENDGTYRVTALASPESVLNIKRDLLKHLNEMLILPDEWLMQLRDYCDNRLAARQVAREKGCVLIPNWQAQWEMVDL